MKFEKYCLHCGSVNHSNHYSCNCKNADWVAEYRALDLRSNWSEEERHTIRESFKNYQFKHPSGLLQYAALPNRDQEFTGCSAVGLTPLKRLHHFGSQAGCEVFLKNEGNNPSGCFKDRETLMCILNSRARNLNRVVIYSSGNAAASAAIFAQQLNFQLITFVAGDTYPEKIDFIRQHGSDVIVVGDENTNFETGFRLFAKINAGGVFSDAGCDNWSVRNPYRVQGDKTTALEIVKQLSDTDIPVVPNYVIAPTANGSCLAGVWKGFLELYELGLIDRLPKMISAGIKNANPVFQAVQKRQTETPEKCDLSRVDDDDASIGSTILAEEGYDSIQAAKAVLESGGMAVEVQRTDIQHALCQLLDEEKAVVLADAILPEPASVITLAALEQLRKKVDLQPTDRVVSLISGHGLKARDKIELLLSGRDDLLEVVSQVIETKSERIIQEAAQPGQRFDVAADFSAVVQTFQKITDNHFEHSRV